MYHAHIHTPAVPMTPGPSPTAADHASRFRAIVATMITAATGLGLLVGMLLVAIVAALA